MWNNDKLEICSCIAVIKPVTFLPICFYEHSDKYFCHNATLLWRLEIWYSLMIDLGDPFNESSKWNDESLIFVLLLTDGVFQSTDGSHTVSYDLGNQIILNYKPAPQIPDILMAASV